MRVLSSTALLALVLGLAACGGGGNGNGDADESNLSGGAGGSGSVSSPEGGTTDAGSSSQGGQPTGGSSGGNAPTGTGGTASSTAGTSGTSSTSTELPDPSQTPAKLDAIGEACESDCDQQFALECAPKNTNTLTCQLTCAAATTQLGDFCLTEYHELIACRAAGGYDCVSDNPYPRSTCAKEQLAFSQCSQQIGCKRACQLKLQLGCSDESFASCVDTCAQPHPVVENASSSICPVYYQQIAYCKAQYATACDGDELELPTQCRSNILQVAECVENHSSQSCAGWCWASEQLGCAPENCEEDCAAKKADTTCGRDYERLLDCTMRRGNEVTCTENGLETTSSSCQSEAERYQTCVDDAAAAP